MSLFTLLTRWRQRGRLIHTLQTRIHRDRLKLRRLKARFRAYVRRDIEWAKTLHACLSLQQQFNRLVAENESLRRHLAAAEEMSYGEKVAQLQARVHELTLQRRALLQTQWTPPAYYSWEPIRILVNWRARYLRWTGNRGARV